MWSCQVMEDRVRHVSVISSISELVTRILLLTDGRFEGVVNSWSPLKMQRYLMWVLITCSQLELPIKEEGDFRHILWTFRFPFYGYPPVMRLFCCQYDITHALQRPGCTKGLNDTDLFGSMTLIYAFFGPAFAGNSFKQDLKRILYVKLNLFKILFSVRLRVRSKNNSRRQSAVDQTRKWTMVAFDSFALLLRKKIDFWCK